MLIGPEMVQFWFCDMVSAFPRDFFCVPIALLHDKCLAVHQLIRMLLETKSLVFASRGAAKQSVRVF